MTKEQSTAEMRYRLSKYVLQVLLDAELITTEEERARRMEAIKKAAVDLVIATERAKQKKSRSFNE